jgi:hypothetical protein
MTGEETDADVLLLEQELLLESDSRGDDAFEPNGDVLLLDTPLAAAGPLMAIDIGQVRGTIKMPKSRLAPAKHDVKVAGSMTLERASPAEADQVTPKGRLQELLLMARHAAAEYQADEARTRKSLYATLAHAYDLSLVVDQDPRGYARLLDEAGLKMQDRAPMTPILNLVFAPDYDKTRLTEYAAVLAYGHRQLILPSRFRDFLEQAKGGLKGIIEIERLFRKGAEGAVRTSDRSEARVAIAKGLRRLSSRPFREFSTGDDEFFLVVARRTKDGAVMALGEVPRDIPLLERAARRLLSEQQVSASDAD